MRTWLAKAVSNSYEFAQTSILMKTVVAAITFLSVGATAAFAQTAHEVGGEASLKLPDLSQVLFLGIDGHRLLMIGILFCFFGLGFGLVIYTRLKKMPVHRAMLEISELIY
jgi:K(+)-stimulated pyrophosphate-energized sodium pump